MAIDSSFLCPYNIKQSDNRCFEVKRDLNCYAEWSPLIVPGSTDYGLNPTFTLIMTVGLSAA